MKFAIYIKYNESIENAVSIGKYYFAIKDNGVINSFQLENDKDLRNSNKIFFLNIQRIVNFIAKHKDHRLRQNFNSNIDKQVFYKLDLCFYHLLKAIDPDICYQSHSTNINELLYKRNSAIRQIYFFSRQSKYIEINIYLTDLNNDFDNPVYDFNKSDSIGISKITVKESYNNVDIINYETPERMPLKTMNLKYNVKLSALEIL